MLRAVSLSRYIVLCKGLPDPWKVAVVHNSKRMSDHNDEHIEVVKACILLGGNDIEYLIEPFCYKVEGSPS